VPALMLKQWVSCRRVAYQTSQVKQQPSPSPL